MGFLCGKGREPQKNFFLLHIFSLTLSIETLGISKKMVSHTVFIQTVAYLMIQDENFTH